MYIATNYIVGWGITAQTRTRKRLLIAACLLVLGLLGVSVNWLPEYQEPFLWITIKANGFFLLIYLAFEWAKMIADKMTDTLYALKRLKRCVNEWSK